MNGRNVKKEENIGANVHAEKIFIYSTTKKKRLGDE
jgi:hypothetical protein